MHIGIILDGNRRWAASKGLPKIVGHKYGLDNLEKILFIAPKHGIEVLTVYALSTENLKRSQEELKNLFDLITKFASKTEKFNKNNIKVNVLGNPHLLREDCTKSLKSLEKETNTNTGLAFQVCVGYGGRDELVRAIKKLNQEGLEVTEESISKCLDSNLEPDLIIRTGGHQRLSNFLTWQSAYSDFLFLDKGWPAFTEEDLILAVEELKSTEKNFGK